MGYVTPSSLQDAVDALSHPEAVIVAGGTDLYPALRDRPVPANLVDISAIPALHGITATPTGWRIGGATTWTDLIRARHLPAAFDGLKAAARDLGSVQIQNVATLAGNLCNASPAADGVPALLALDAEVELIGPTGTRVMPLATFVTGPRQTQLRPGDLMVALYVPALPDSSQSSFLKLGSRRYLVISIAMVAVVLWLDDQDRVVGARVAVGACSAVAQRLPKLEADLRGRPVRDLLTEPLVTKAHLASLAPIDDIRGSATYRQDAALHLCQRALRAAAVKFRPADE
ncbi:xanthine dehydrogenase family protein subunit M [Pseudoruegeria sp. SK021]|uniref:FAD binding domain-containing protein n=1 Tax=Pseudoruegeria sp. SK021 TaxID=1933035 RepID=UPI000A239622|nr:xanthine dehydrogenase family protein subunit M [Pseudoruegeria sp. SK021]OSP55874.1 xanthine dehydrogenase [Pseudoruegeria sp. SK021]